MLRIPVGALSWKVPGIRSDSTGIFERSNPDSFRDQQAGTQKSPATNPEPAPTLRQLSEPIQWSSAGLAYFIRQTANPAFRRVRPDPGSVAQTPRILFVPS